MRLPPNGPAGRRLNAVLRFLRNEGGVTAVEFGFVVLPFMALVFAIMETSLVYFAGYELDNATDQATREIRTGQAQGMSADQFKQLVCSKLPVFITCDSNLMVDVRSFPTYAAAASGAPNPYNPNGTLNPKFAQYNIGQGGSIELVTVLYDWKSKSMGMPALGAFTGDSGIGLANMPDGSRLIIAAAAFKNEPF
jgi:Flp pilus assembly protein TadG